MDIIHMVDACRDYCSNTSGSTSNFVEILRFKHYIQKVYFIPEGKNYRNKVIKNHILVRVVLDLGCGYTLFGVDTITVEPTQTEDVMETTTAFELF